MQEHNVDTTTVMPDPLVVDGLIVGKTAHGRSVFSAAGKAAVARLFKESVASAARIAHANGINENLVAKWARTTGVRHKSKRTVSVGKPELIAIQVKSAPSVALAQSIQIELPKGVIRMTLARVQDLGLVIDQLSSSR